MSAKKEKTEVIPTCGIIMPISAIDDCSTEHWADVLEIIKDVCEANGFKSDLVSDGLDVGVIQNRIVENVYSSDIVICDVSCKNANVMFELGMRLAFDKPTILIKDEITGYCFDTGVIEHIEYPRDLRFNKINSFKEVLGKKLVATFNKSKEDPHFSTFLKHFGKYKIAHLDEIEITSENYILKAIDELKGEFRNFKNLSKQSNGVHEYKLFRSSDGREIGKSIGTISTSQWVRKQIDEYFKTKINPSAPYNAESVISDIIKSIDENPFAPSFPNRELFENTVREHVELL